MIPRISQQQAKSKADIAQSLHTAVQIIRSSSKKVRGRFFPDNGTACGGNAATVSKENALIFLTYALHLPYP
jgi:hypothetical protein